MAEHSGRTWREWGVAPLWRAMRWNWARGNRRAALGSLRCVPAAVAFSIRFGGMTARTPCYKRPPRVWQLTKDGRWIPSTPIAPSWDWMPDILRLCLRLPFRKEQDLGSPTGEQPNEA